MKRLTALTASALAVAAVSASPAAASPTPTFTATPMASQTVMLDASATPCHFGACSYEWRYFTATTNRLGVQMGREARVTYRFPSFGWYTVVVKMGERCYAGAARTCAGSTTQSVYSPATWAMF